MENAPTRAFSWLKAATNAFTFKTLLRHYAKRALTLVGAFSVITNLNLRMELFEALTNKQSVKVVLVMWIFNFSLIFGRTGSLDLNTLILSAPIIPIVCSMLGLFSSFIKSHLILLM